MRTATQWLLDGAANGLDRFYVRTALTVQQTTRSGLTPSYSAANVDGHSIPNTGAEILHIKTVGTACTVTVEIPGTVDGQPRRWTDAQATGAWGEPSAVLLRCGVEAPGPTEARCITLGGVDWIVDESQAPRYLVTTYGRTPAVEVFIDNEAVSPNEALTQLAETAVLGGTTVQSECTLTEELLPEATSADG